MGENNSKIKDNAFVVLAPFMPRDLKLKGNELIIYAIIHSFSIADGVKEYTGSLQYLAEWTNSTKQGVLKALKSLVSKGYIEKNDTIINGVKYCSYHVTEFNSGKQSLIGIQQSSMGVLNSVEQGIQQSLTNNKEYNKDNIKDDNIELVEATPQAEPPQPTTRENIDYQRIVDMYNTTCVSFPKLKILSDSRKKTIKARFKTGYTYEDFQTLFNKAENSSFLKGANNRNWSATFDWLIKDGNIAKVLEGNYDEKNNQQMINGYQPYIYNNNDNGNWWG